MRCKNKIYVVRKIQLEKKKNFKRSEREREKRIIKNYFNENNKINFYKYVIINNNKGIYYTFIASVAVKRCSFF